MKVVKIPTKKITQFETKQTPTIQQEKNIIKKDNIGTVVPGDALRNINLSTVPSVVQDAINAMGLSVETNILANALLLQIQRDIDNLGDAIVEKSYIDGQVSYLTSLLGQKSDTGDVASIVDSRIAIVTEDFATTAQVNNLNSRVGESESSITTLNQTINTKDAARATQIEEVEARVNQSLSNYTAVLNLTVDENGNVISQKIESLVAQNARANISIDENNKITLDENGNFTAYVAKFINDGHGNIVGFSFTDSDDAQSVFGINADVFQVSDATNRYTPFRIENGNIYLNGKATFANITNSTGDTLPSVLDKLQNDLSGIISENNTTALLAIANLDGKIDTKEAELINSINAEAQARIDAIAERVQQEALLDGKITVEEQARIDSTNALTLAYQNYTDTVKQALIDGEITDAEANAILEAQNIVNAAKAQLETQINNLTKVEDINWQQQVQSAIDNNATTIDGGKIVTNQAFVNNLNAVGGVVADTITGNELNGIVINGARINGSVIKASYLDLDGDLEVLTNYIITMAMYTANPSLYTDAVYIAADNQYRIPTLSTVREANSTTTINTGSTTFNSIIHSYSTANVGNNNKAVRINPQVIVTSNVEVVDITFKTAYLDQFSWWNGPILNTSDSFSITVRILGVACVFTFKPGYWDDAWYPVFYSSGLVVNNNGSTVINVASVLNGNSNVNQDIYINGLLFNVALANNKVSTYTGGNDGGYNTYCSYPSLKITLLSGTYSPANWSNAYSLIQVTTSGVTDRGFGRLHAPTGTAYSSKVIRNSSGIMINNMI